jgi:hypothetical protein
MNILFLLICAVEDTSEGAVVQRKGRFKVTSADLSPKVYMITMLWPLVNLTQPLVGMRTISVSLLSEFILDKSYSLL